MRSNSQYLYLVVALACAATARADDWPQWMGPTRDGVYGESGIVQAIPEGGLPVKWRAEVHGGYAGPAVVGNRVFLTDFRRTKGEMVVAPDKKPAIEGFERVLCLDAESGKKIWEHEYPCSYRVSYPAGPRATPTVKDGVVYALGTQGDFMALSADDGRVKWHVNIPKRFNAPVPMWGFAAHPLVVDDMVLTMVGGEDQAVVAFDRASGSVKWKALSSKDAGYCPPSIIKAGGTEQLLVWHPSAVASLDPRSGKEYWSVPLEPEYGMSIARPQRDGNYLFVAGIMYKGVMLRLHDDKPGVTELWRGSKKTAMYTPTHTPVMHDGIMYGCDDALGALIAAKVEDGSRLWQTYHPVVPGRDRRLSCGSVAVTRHASGNRFLLFGEMGQLTLADMDEEGYKPKGQMKVLEPTQTTSGRDVVWTHPAYAGRTMFVRNDKEIVAVDLSAK